MKRVLFITITLFAIAGANVTTQPVEQYADCRKNVQNLAAQVEWYRSEHNGCLPESLEKAIESNGFLSDGDKKSMLTCPAANITTYKYQVLGERTYKIFCSGSHHRQAAVEADKPEFTNTQE